MTPLLSIIIPIYNTEKHLHKCIQSILSLSIEQLEIILVDDGSTDTSGSICDYWARKYDFIKVIHKINGGVSSARNLGIKIAQGKYIAFIDSDDYIVGKSFKIILNTCIDKDLDVCFYKIKIMEKNGEGKIGFNHAFSYNHIYTGEEIITNDLNASSACIAFFKLKHIQEHSISFSEDMTHSEDADFVTHAVVFAEKIMFTDYVPYVYAYNDSSATKLAHICPEKRQRKILSNIIMAQRLKNLALNESISKRMRHYIKKWANSIAIGIFISIIKKRNYKEDLVFFSRHGCSAKILPIKGGTLSWKTTILVPIINIIANFKTE